MDLVRVSLHDADDWVRRKVAEALGQMMAQGVRIFEESVGKWEVRTVAELSR